MELTGFIKKIGEIQTFNSGFQKLEMVITTEEQYPQPICIEFLQDKCDLPLAHEVGDKVTVGINLRGREWTSPQNEVKYFNSIVGWRIQKSGVPKPANDKNEPTSVDPYPTPKQPENPFEDDEDDDLPF